MLVMMLARFYALKVHSGGWHVISIRYEWYCCYHPYALDEETKAWRRKHPYWKAQLPVEELGFSQQAADLISKSRFLTTVLWLPFRVSKSLISGELSWNPPGCLLKIQLQTLPNSQRAIALDCLWWRPGNLHFNKFPRCFSGIQWDTTGKIWWGGK